MTTCNFQCNTCSLLHSKVVWVIKSEQDYKEMKGHMQWLQLISDQKTFIGLEKLQKPHYNNL